MAEAGRRLAEAGGRPELDLVLAGRAGGRDRPKPQGGCFHIAVHSPLGSGEATA